MRTVLSSITFPVNPATEVTIKSRNVEVSGKFGSLSRSFRHSPIDMRVITKPDGSKHIHIDMWFARKKQTACLRTIKSHITNMMIGVTKQFVYKMRFVYAHFPINSNITEGGKLIQIRNFLGDKRTRAVEMLEGVKVEKTETKDEIQLTGINVENVSQSAALIHQSTLVHHKDIRQFLDGIYVSERGTVVQDAQ